MRLFIPSVGIRIRLTKPWTFDLHYESRNEGFWKGINSKYKFDWRDRDKAPVPTTLPKGTVLEVDRVYIRAQNKIAQSTADDYDSLTFKVVEHETLAKVRFWAKLQDVNAIDYDLPKDFDESKVQAKVNALKLNTANRVIKAALETKNPEWLTESTKKQLLRLAPYFKVMRGVNLKPQECLYQFFYSYTNKSSHRDEQKRKVWRWSGPDALLYSVKSLKGILVDIVTEPDRIVEVRVVMPK